MQKYNNAEKHLTHAFPAPRGLAANGGMHVLSGRALSGSLLRVFGVGLLIKTMLLSTLLLIQLPAAAMDDPVLLAVEADQTDGVTRSGIASTNLLLGRYGAYAHCSSYRSGRFARRICDGDVDSGWELNRDETTGWVDATLGLAMLVDTIVVTEQGDQVRSFTLSVTDGAQWQQVAQGDSLGRRTFRFEPMLISGVRLDVITAGGGGIAEVEIHDASGVGLARVGRPTAALGAAFAEGRVALLLGSPYVMDATGRDLLDPRDPEVRPVPGSVQYLPRVLSAVFARFGVEAEWNKQRTELRGRGLTGDFAVTIPASDGSVTTTALLLGAVAKAGIAGSESDAVPGLLIFGEPLPAASAAAIARELKAILVTGPGATSRARSKLPPTAGPHAVIKPNAEVLGRTLPWVGTRADIFPGTNCEAWLQYLGPNAIRTWNGERVFNDFIKVPRGMISSLAEFDEIRSAVRADPGHGGLIDWEALLASDQHRSMVAEYAAIRRLGMDVINETGAKDWDEDWNRHLHAWLVTYVATYHLAKHFDVAVHQYGNEPDGKFKQRSEAEIALRIQLVADAVHSAIADVNQRYGKQLEARFSAPVLAGTGTGDVARIMMRNLRTNYRGETIDHDLVQYFNKHRYSERARRNVLEVDQQRAMMCEESPHGTALPQIYTEFNWSTGGNWARPHIRMTNDSPEVIHSVASIWGQMMATQEVYGMFLFRFNTGNTGEIRWTNSVCPSFVREGDGREAALFKPRGDLAGDVGYVTRNAELLRLFAQGFAGGRELLNSGLVCSDPQYQVYTSHAPEDRCYYLMTVQANDTEDYEVELDLTDLDVPAGAAVTVCEISAGSFGEVMLSDRVPGDRKLRFIQPSQSVWLVSISKFTTRQQVHPVSADATVSQGSSVQVNHGGDAVLAVRRHSDAEHNRITYLRFANDGTEGPVHRALLQVHGQRVSAHDYDGAFVFRVYGLPGAGWDEQQITGENAPGIFRTVSAMADGVVTPESPPVGHLTVTNTAAWSTIDVTDFVNANRDRELTFCLIRELNYPGENSDDAWARLDAREAGEATAPRLVIIK